MMKSDASAFMKDLFLSGGQNSLSEAELFTSDRAALLLQNVDPSRYELDQNGNVILDMGKVKEIALDMQAGTFEQGPDPIVMTPDGVLLDGAHRLAACLYCGHFVKMNVEKTSLPDKL